MNEFRLEDFFSFDIRPFCSVVKFDTAAPILREGAASSCLYYLTEGRAKLYLTHENGRVSLINFLDAPCFIGEMEFIGAQACTKGVSAITPCTCYRIDTEHCRDLILEDAKFLRCLCLFLGQKTLSNTANYTRNQAYPLENRLAAFILMTAAGGIYRERHTEAAEFLGVSYRHLLYVLADFVKRNILNKTKTGYLITDAHALHDLADKVTMSQ